MNNIINKLLFLLLTLSCRDLYAQKQGQPLVDSLLPELPRQKEDSNKVDMLVSMSFAKVYNNPDEGIKYGQQALALAIRINWKKGIAHANRVLGDNYISKSYFPKALEYLLKALKIEEEIGDKDGVARITGNIGVVYNSLTDYTTALEYYFKALKMAEEIGNKEEIAINTVNIGGDYIAMKNYPKALEYYSRALKMDEEMGDKNGVADDMIDMGESYSGLKNYPQALAYYFKSLPITKETGERIGQSEALRVIGVIYLSLDTTTQQIPKKLFLQAGLQQKDIPANKKKCLVAAIDYLQHGLEIVKNVNDPDEMLHCYEVLVVAYTLNGDYKNALESSANANAIKDSVYSKENDEKMMRVAMDYDYRRGYLSDSLTAMKNEKAAALKLQKQKGYTLAGLAGVLLLVGFSFFIVKERRKSESLLLNILPSEVAAELKEKGISEARQFDAVTVILSDFVNFTKTCERLSPEALVSELDACFKAFDNIMAKYNIEKIKTIGDAYLAVCGLPLPNLKHAENTVLAALDMQAFMQDRLAKLGDNTFEVRIGIHSGSVVAGIVGIKKFAYDIWGDTVNITAIMEQNSKAGRINISQASYELVKDKFTCEYHGKIEGKNKEPLKMYFVS